VYHFVISKKFDFHINLNFISSFKKVQKSESEIKIDLKMIRKYAIIQPMIPISNFPLLVSKMKGAAL